MNLEQYARDLMKNGGQDALRKLASSGAGAKLSRFVDSDAMETAAREGDMKALSAMLQDILKTPEGQNFAAEVRKAVRRDER